MSNELIPREITQGALAIPENFDILSGSTYLPRFQLFTSNSDACKEGKIPIGHYALVLDDSITDLGDCVDVLIISYRPKAVKVEGDELIISFDLESDVFKSVMAQAELPNSGCMYGNELLLWIPAVQQFATYHMNNKTARREAKAVKPLLGRQATFKVHLIKTSRYSWHGPVVLPCSAPIEMPPADKLTAEAHRFHNPSVQDEVEMAQGDDRPR